MILITLYFYFYTYIIGNEDAAKDNYTVKHVLKNYKQKYSVFIRFDSRPKTINSDVESP